MGLLYVYGINSIHSGRVKSVSNCINNEQAGKKNSLDNTRNKLVRMNVLIP